MAESNEICSRSISSRSTLDLDENMIPGASLGSKLPETLTKAQLVRWLKCRKGASVAGKKAELVQRVNHYIRNGWDRKYLIHPDKHSLKLYTEETVNCHQGFVSAILDHPPPAGYTNNLEGVPIIEDSDIYQYFLVKCDRTMSTAQKHRDKGWVFYKSDKVICSEFKLDADEEVMLIRGDVIASFDRGFITSSKPNKKYPVHICLDKHSGSILGGRCLCKAGFGGYCKHVAAILFQVRDCQRAGSKFTPAAKSQTSKIQTWHKPKVVGQACIKCSDIEIEAFNYERDTGKIQKKLKVDYKSYDSCPDGQNCITKAKTEKFSTELRSLGVAAQLVDILEGNNYEPVHSATVNIHNQTEATGCLDTEPINHSIVSFEKTFSVTEAEYEFYENNVKISTSEEQQSISQKIVGQSSSEFWARERSKRLTSSHFREVAHRTKFPADKLIERLTNPKPFKSIHTTWGKQAEPLALAQYKTQKEQEGYIVSGQDIGLIVNPGYPYLGASPDWLVSLHDPSSGFTDNGLVEVKSLSKHSNLHPREAATIGDMFVFINEKGELIIKPDHAYYYQIQGQLNICNVNWCDLVVWTPRGMEILRIKRCAVLAWAIDTFVELLFSKYAASFSKTVLTISTLNI